MQNFITFFLISLIVIQCSAQKTDKEIIEAEGSNYFIGIWVLKEKNYKEDDKIKSFPLHECMKQYKLLFKKENENILLTKEFATGKQCSVKSTSGQVKATIENGAIKYLEDDVERYDHFKIYSKNRFSIVFSDILYGKVTEIEDVYEKLK